MGKGRKNKRPAPAAAAAAAPAAGVAVTEVNFHEVPPVESEAGAEGHGVPMPTAPPVDEANGGEPPAETGSEGDDEEDLTGHSSPEREREGEGEVEKLKALNGRLVKEAVEERGKVAALAVRADERSADAAALAGVEREVLRAALVGPLLAAAEEGAALRARLVAVPESLDAAEARAAREADARGEAAARLDAADAENRRVLELLGAKEAEAAAAARNVAELEAVVGEFAGKSTELSAERGELEKQLGEMTASARRIEDQKAEVEGSFEDLKKNTEMYKQEMAGKLEKKLGELEVLKSEKAEMEAKFQSLEVEFSAVVAWNRELESQVETSKTELAAAKTEVEKLQFEVSEVGKKYGMVVAESEGLRTEIAKMMTIKEAAGAAFHSEKTRLERELDGLKRKVDLIQANKDAALGMVHEKDAEATRLRAELEKLHVALAEQHALRDDLSADFSCLQDEKDKVLKALDEERAEGGNLKLRSGELESYNAEKDREIGVLKAEVEDKEGKIDGLSGELEQLQLAVAEAQQREKSRVWTLLCPATTTVIAAASFAYAARSR